MKDTTKRVLTYAVPILIIALIFRYFSNILDFSFTLLSAVSSLIMGFCYAYVLNLFMSMFERHFFPNSKNKLIQKIRRPLGIVASLLFIILIITLVLVLILPKLGETFVLLGSFIPSAINDISKWVTKLGTDYPFLEDNINEFLNKFDFAALAKEAAAYLGNLGKNFLASTTSVIASVTGAVTNFFLSLIFALYLLADKEKLVRQTNRIFSVHLPESVYRICHHVLQIANESFSRYIVGQCTEALILGSLCTLGMALLRLPYAPMIGAVIGVTALIPVVGAYIGAGVGAFLILMISPLQAVVFLIFIVILQQLEGNLIYPRVVGSSIGLPGIWVLAAVTVGGALCGIPGILFGVPLVSMLYKLLKEYTSYKEALRAPAVSKHPDKTK